MKRFLVAAAWTAALCLPADADAITTVVDNGASSFRPLARNEPNVGSVWSSLAQSFTAVDSRITFGFRFLDVPFGHVNEDAGATIVYELYEGDGDFSPAALLASRTVALPGTYTNDPRLVDLGFVDADFSDVTLDIGHVYTMKASVPPEDLPSLGDDTGYGIWTSNENFYDGGRFYFPVGYDNSLLGNYEMLFRMTTPCGDGVLQDEQECDDGTPDYRNGDLCSGLCTLVPCGQPTRPFAEAVSAGDALFILKSAIGLSSCDLRVCDVDDSAGITSVDALLVLRKTVGVNVVLHCPS